jgi:hypothetical protein
MQSCVHQHVRIPGNPAGGEQQYLARQWILPNKLNCSPSAAPKTTTNVPGSRYLHLQKI